MSGGEGEAADEAHLTPMMQQYLEIKAAYKDVLLFYRMGDFYELFFDDALIASKVLSITLTKRGKHLGADIAMCGVPVHTANEYLHRLIASGFNVAICEQVDAGSQADSGTKAHSGTKKSKARKLIAREVVRLVTPATLTEEGLLDAGRANYLMALARIKTPKNLPSFALAVIDISTGSFLSLITERDRLLADIVQFSPKELIISEPMFHDPDLRSIFDALGRVVVPQPASLFDPTVAESRLCAYYQVATLASFAAFSSAEMVANAAALAYIEKTQMAARPPLMRPQRQIPDKNLFIDPATRLNLELSRTLSGTVEGSLLTTIDRTLTGAGARLLAERLAQPLCQVEAIATRLDSVGFFVHEPLLCDDVRSALKGLSDMERALVRLSVGRGSPRDLGAMLRGLETGAALATLFEHRALPDELNQALLALKSLPSDLQTQLDKALVTQLPLTRREGGFIRAGFDDELDEMRELRDQSRRVIAALQSRYAEITEIKNLKIKHNNVLGFFVEVNASQANLLQKEAAIQQESQENSPIFLHRQSVANAMRFTTSELAELEGRIAQAGERALSIESRIFDAFCAQILANIEVIRAAASALSVLDVSAALAVLAEEQGYCRPVIDDSLAFEVVAGRHPVVEQSLRQQASAPFVVNDCQLSPPKAAGFGAIWLLTGPNMGGKSTFLRQNALIAIMAQMGSFVPAGSAHIGVVNRLFSRVGASDDLARGRSTFMVEMVETAAILNQADKRSLVILDEIGRGTSTFDGLSIAWATLEHLHDVNHCRAIFATHFHELTVLAKKLPRLANQTMKVKEWQGDVVFLHEVSEGAADRSYGVQVAKLAGLPPVVVARARDVLAELEMGEMSGRARQLIDDLPFFSELLRPSIADSIHSESLENQREITAFLSKINPDELTPRQALEALYQLKNLLDP